MAFRNAVTYRNTTRHYKIRTGIDFYKTRVLKAEYFVNCERGRKCFQLQPNLATRKSETGGERERL
jgi:hypothetical protein